MSEQDLRGRINRMLKPLHAIAVENPALPGTPDVNYIGGWLELKQLRSWPVLEATNVVIEHFTPQQRVWHLQRRMLGGTSRVIIQCRREWLAMDGAVAALWLNFLNRSELIQRSENYSDNGMDQRKLISWCQQKQSAFSLSADDAQRLKQMLHDGLVSL